MNSIIQALLENGTIENNTLLITNLIASHHLDEAMDAMKNYEFLIYDIVSLRQKEKSANGQEEQSYSVFHEVLKSNDTSFINNFFELTHFSFSGEVINQIEKSVNFDILKSLCEKNSFNALSVLHDKKILDHVANNMWKKDPMYFSMVTECAYKNSNDQVLDLIEKNFPIQNIYKQAKYYIERENNNYLHSISNHLLHNQLNIGNDKNQRELRDSLKNRMRLPTHFSSKVYLSTLLLLDEMYDAYEKLLNFLPNYAAKNQNQDNQNNILNMLNDTHQSEDNLMAYKKMLMIIEKFTLDNNIENTKTSTTKLKI